jgi:hypothetical protein
MLAAEIIDGKQILIDNLHITTVDQQLNLSMDAYIEGSLHHIVFHNISSLCIDSFSYPMQISGFAVTDNSANGWQSDARYEIYDFEDGAIRFFCKDITVLD